MTRLNYSLLTFTCTSQKNEVFVDTKSMPIMKKIVRAPEFQDEFESRK